MVSFLMMGQSNMSGRGLLNEVHPLPGDRLFMLRNGRWQPLKEPVSCDRPFAGISLAPMFARLYADEHPQEEIGLIPCAEGGANLEIDWCVGGLLYDHALMQAKLAMRTSTLKAILWHQGEGDSCEHRASLYGVRLERLLDAFRSDLDLPDLPVMVGGLGDYLEKSTEKEKYASYAEVNRQLRQLCSEHKEWMYADASGLECNADGLHFSAPSLRKFGERYYEQWKKWEKLSQNDCI